MTIFYETNSTIWAIWIVAASVIRVAKKARIKPRFNSHSVLCAWFTTHIHQKKNTQINSQMWGGTCLQELKNWCYSLQLTPVFILFRQTNMHACIHTHIHIHTHTYIHACMHAYMHAYIHTCIHTYCIFPMYNKGIAWCLPNFLKHPENTRTDGTNMPSKLALDYWVYHVNIFASCYYWSYSLNRWVALFPLPFESFEVAMKAVVVALALQGNCWWLLGWWLACEIWFNDV